MLGAQQFTSAASDFIELRLQGHGFMLALLLIKTFTQRPVSGI
jgi:hypothetical protein